MEDLKKNFSVSFLFLLCTGLNFDKSCYEDVEGGFFLFVFSSKW